MSGLAEAPDEHLVGGLQEDHPRTDPATLQGATHRREGQRGIAGPDVDDDRDLGEPVAIGRDQIRELRQ